jgi:outer membrane protein assembly factor BamB
LTWVRKLKTEGVMADAAFEFGQPAYSATAQLAWAGSANGQLYCFNTTDGSIVWRRDVGGIRSGITLANDILYVGVRDGRLAAYDARSGDERWHYRVKGVVVKAPVVAGQNILVVDGTNAIYAINGQTGKWAWQYRRESPRHFAVFGEARPSAKKRRVYVGFSDGHVVALSPKDGAVLWTKNLAPETPKFLDVDASVISKGKTVFGASIGGGLYALDRKTGKTRWTLPIMGIVGLTLHEGDLVASLDTGRVIRIDTFGRRIRWSTHLKTRSGFATEPIVWGNHVLVTLSKGPLYWLDAATGRPIRQFNSGPGFSVAPQVGPDGIFALDNDATLFAFKTNVTRQDNRRTPLSTSR